MVEIESVGYLGLEGHLGLLPPARDHRDEARRPSGRGWLSDGQAVGPMPLGTAHLRSDEGPPPEALLTSRRARSGEGSAPRAPGDHGKDTGKV